MEYRNEYLESAGGVRLFVREAVLAGPVRAEVVLTHGRGEHSGRYGHVAEALARAGLRLWCYDLRGHGRSEGPRGDAPSYGALLDDLDAVVKLARVSGLPLFIFGHSMGGQIVLNYVLNRGGQCRGLIVASPYLRLAFAPPWWRLALAFVARWLRPGLTQPTPLAWTRLSRDQAHLESFPDREMMHHLISARMYHAVRDGAESALAGAGRLELPLLLIHGAADPVTSMEASREFFARVGSADKTLKLYAGMLHETHNEIGREQVLTDMVEWIEGKL